MKKIPGLLAFLALALPALARDQVVALDPAALIRSKYNFYERAGVTGRDGYSIAVSSRGWIVKLDDSGKALWRIKSGCVPGSPAALDEQMVYYPCENGQYLALESATGKQLWKYDFADSVASPAAIGEDFIIFQTGDGRVFSLNKSDGSLKWLARQTARYNLSLRPAGAPLILDRVIYLGMADGVFAALNVESGDLIWKRRIFERPITSDIDFPLIYDDQAIYASSREGICSVSRTSGKNYWCLDEQLALAPAQDADAIYALSTADELLIIDKLAGKALKRIAIEQSGLAKFECQNPLLVLPDQEDVLIVFSNKIIRIQPQSEKPKLVRFFTRLIQSAEFLNQKLYLISSKGLLILTEI